MSAVAVTWHCPYCGYPRRPGSLACTAHKDLPALDEQLLRLAAIAAAAQEAVAA